MKFKFVTFILLFLSFSSYAPAISTSTICQGAVEEVTGPKISYVHGIRDAQHKITFGLEVEFQPQERNSAILKDYCPSNYPAEEWIKLPLTQKIIIFKSTNFAKDGVILKKFKGPQWMPPSLDNDQSGNKEANKFIFESLDQLKQTLLAMEERYGRGAAQIHVVFPFDSTLMGQAGYIAFSGDRAQLKNLEIGYAKHLKDPTNIPGKSLSHFGLAPMNNEGLEVTRRSERYALAQKIPFFLDWEVKRYLSTVFRIDKYVVNVEDESLDSMLVGYELRQFNYDYEGLLAEAESVARILEIDGIKSFAKFDRNSNLLVLNALLLENLETFKMWNQALEDYPDDTMVLKPYFFGFQNWAQHPILDTLPPEARTLMVIKIQNAQRVMFKEFIVAVGKKRSFSGIRDQLAISLAKFAYTVQLGGLFDQYNNEIIH